MYYIYKHLNAIDEVIYIGKTIRMNRRQREHLNKSIWKNDISKILFCEVENKTIMDLYEVYLINTLNPKYNTKDNRNDELDYIRFKDYDFLDYKIDFDELRRNVRIKIKPEDISYDYYGKYVCLTNCADSNGCVDYDKEKLMKFFNLSTERALEIFIKSIETSKLISKNNKVLNVKLTPNSQLDKSPNPCYH